MKEADVKLKSKMKRVVFLICCVLFCSALSWGQTWKLTETMEAKLYDGGSLYIYSSLRNGTKIGFEAMPDFSQNHPAPWSAVRNKIKYVDIGYIGNNITSIGNYAFENCSNLTYIEISESVTSIGKDAFLGCTNLDSVRVKWIKPLSLSNNIFSSANIANMWLEVPYGAKWRYQAANVWKDFGTIDTKGDMDDFLEQTGFGVRTMSWCVLILSVILLLVRIAKEKGEPRRGVAYFFYNMLFLFLCVIEILFATRDMDGIPWFCDPNDVGWLWTIINFLLFGAIIYNQILCLFDALDDIFANNNTGCDLRLGYYSWIVGAIGALICALFFEDKGIQWVFIILGIMQIIQSILIFISFGKNVRGALLCVFVYLLGTIGIAAALKVFVVMFIIVAVVGAVLYGMLNGKRGSSSSTDSNAAANCRSCSRFPGHAKYCDAGRRYVSDYGNTQACEFYRF